MNENENKNENEMNTSDSQKTESTSQPETETAQTVPETQETHTSTDSSAEPHIENAEFTAKPNSQNTQNKQNEKHRFHAQKEKKPHPILTLVLTAAVALGCGYGGGLLAVKSSGSSGTTVIYKDVTSTISTTSSDSSASSSSSSDLTLQEIAAKAQPSVVEIVVETTTTGYGMFGQQESGTSEAAGSGVIISTDGYIITNNHVIEDADSIKVTLYDGTEYDATLIGTDSKSDIAVIKVDATDLTAAVIGDSSTIEVGDTAVVIGNPLGTLGGTVTNGIISATNREVTINNESMNLIQTNAAINSGNSGGGMFDGQGCLIGIVNAKDSGTTSSGATIEGLGFAIPINDAMDVASQLMSNGYVSDRATLGVYLQDVTSDTGSYKAGLYITSVVTGSGAEAAGLQAYDRIIAADGTEISTYTELSKILKTKNVGDTIDLTIVRDGQTMDVTVNLTSTIQNTQKS